MTQNRVVGKDGQLPWQISEDLKNFKTLTAGNTVVMGRKTFDSIPEKFRPLPNRHNIIISRTLAEMDGVDVCESIPEALEKAKSYGKEIFIIGGGTIYEQTIPVADKMVLSYIKEEYEGDVHFPIWNKEEWNKTDTQEFDEFKLVTYERK